MDYSPEGIYGIAPVTVRIAVHGKARSGKSTFTEMVLAALRSRGMFAEEFAFADALYAIVGFTQQKLCVKVEKDPRLMQKTADCHKVIYGDDVYARVLKNRMNSGSIVVSDLRHKVEMTVIREMGSFTTVRITRKNRVCDRDPDHISEVDLDDVDMDYTFANDGDFGDLQRFAETFVAAILARESTCSAR